MLFTVSPYTNYVFLRKNISDDNQNILKESQVSELFTFDSCLLCVMSSSSTLKCLSIGTSKTISFPFVSNEKLMMFRCLNIQAHYNEAVIYLNFGTPKNDEFSIWNKWKIYYF